jgi:hypothetical protein
LSQCPPALSGKTNLLIATHVITTPTTRCAIAATVIDAEPSCASRLPAKYTALRQRRHSHARALRSVDDRLLNVACAMLGNGTQFNPSLEGQKNAC